jgi:uncharacterized protein with HEPN domain
VRSDRLLVQDALDAVGEVMDTTPPTRQAFDQNKLVRSHVLRNIQIIGEACWRMSQTLKDQHPQVPWRQIAGMRHVLVHDYFQVNWDRVYDTAVKHVPLLKPQLDAVLEALPPATP